VEHRVTTVFTNDGKHGEKSSGLLHIVGISPTPRDRGQKVTSHCGIGWYIYDVHIPIECVAPRAMVICDAALFEFFNGLVDSCGRR